MKKHSILLVAFLLFPVVSVAYQIKQKYLQEQFDDSVKVARVKVVSSRQALNENYDCGIDYTADVVTNFKGDKSKFIFRSTTQLIVGNEYLVFVNNEFLDAHVNYLSMGKSDVAGYDACTEEKLLYVSGFHGEIYEFDLLWKTISGEESVKATVEVPYLQKLGAEKVEFKSGQVSNTYLDEMSFWRICWSSFEKELVALSE